MTKRIVLVFLFSCSLLFARWGWGSHRFINDAAVNYLPLEMSFFQDYRDYLSQHSVDPDTDDLPGYYHYIDIDYYPEFFSGELPHEWQAMIDLYGQNTMEDNGVVPWAIEWWMNDLQALMQNGDWGSVWQTAAELGHYIGDSHQALHLTLNYNGGLTGNYGIHSRYETQMINPHLESIVLPDSTAGYWVSPLDSIFAYIDDIYPLVDLIMTADNAAYNADPNHGSTYFNMMWEDLGEPTIWALGRAALDVASIWHTAWLNAGSPYPEGVGVEDDFMDPETYKLHAYPNPFNAQTNLSFQLHSAENLTLRILDIRGKLIKTLAQGEFSGGTHSFAWEGIDMQGYSVNSGVYFFQIIGKDRMSIHKLTVIK